MPGDAWFSIIAPAQQTDGAKKLASCLHSGYCVGVYSMISTADVGLAAGEVLLTPYFTGT